MITHLLVSKYNYFSSIDGTDEREVSVVEQSLHKFYISPFNHLSIDETLSIKAFDAIVILSGTVESVKNSDKNAG